MNNHGNMIGHTDPQNYNLYLDEKITFVTNLLSEKSIVYPKYEIFKSPAEYYRMRCEFGINFADDFRSFDYCMFVPHSKPKERIIIKDFKVCSKSINQAMSILREHLTSFHELSYKLFEVSFLSNKARDVIINLNYHKQIKESLFKEEAEALKQLFAKENLHINIVGRAKKQKVLANTDTILETISTSDKDFFLYQVEGNFTQPNIYTCQHMVDFVRKNCSKLSHEEDLLELYCGSGTFTVCLAELFRKVLATEVSRVPTATALLNLEKNHIRNTSIVRLSAVEVAEALTFKREFRRLKLCNIDLKSYNLTTLLIDPPRNGLEFDEARQFAQKFDRIIYVSCGPQSFATDLVQITKTHNIKKLAFFDQFPYTEHLESIAILEKKNKA